MLGGLGGGVGLGKQDSERVALPDIFFRLDYR